MANKSLAIIAAIAVIGLLFLVYLAATFETPEGTRTVAIETPVPIAPAPVERVIPPEPVAQTVIDPAPAVVQTLIEVPPEPAVIEEVVDLPTLNLSDAFVLTRLGALETGARLLELLSSEELVRRFVVFVENVSQGSLPQLEYPVRRLQQPMAVREIDENLYEMQSVSYQRYTPLIDALTAVNPEQALAIYRVLKPLFQEAFAEIGYPNRNFDEVVIRAIDNVLNAQTAEGPFQLVKPKVMYVYADAGVESMTPVEKQLLRMGPQNAEKLKAALAQYREHLAAR
ncbi:MAG: DUF3014 domain-containing protein [Gammaproteobacteria bacterium]|nr:DUF3014 domain-containing protein [Gammaproteobacteria bacterium]